MKLFNFLPKAFLAFVFLFFFQTAYGQQCFLANTTFNTQAQLNQFGISYPTCTIINGNVTIEGPDITDLSPLQNFIDIRGYLLIKNNSSLQNLDGLNNLASIGASWNSSLFIENNPILQNIDGLSALINISGNLIISSNNLLQNINGLNSLTNSGSLTIEANPALQNLDAFSGLTGAGANIRIENNSQLQNLNGLIAITGINGFIRIRNNTSLTDISGIQNIDLSNIITTTGLGVNISNNINLTICNYPNLCEYLSNPTNYRVISGNAGNCSTNAILTTACNVSCTISFLTINTQAELDAFAVTYAHCNEITITGNLTIQGFDISDLSPLQKLTSIGGILNINQNFSLTSLAGLENIDPTSITNLIIYENFDLSLCSLPNICEYLSFDPVDFPRNISINAGNCSDEYAVGALCLPDCDIPGNLTFNSQAGLNDFILISAHCTEITISGNLTIQGFDITDLTPLQKIISIGGMLNILNNAQLQNLDGLDNVTSIGGSVSITNNPTLTNLIGLSGATVIGGSLTLTNNQALTNINGLSGITNIGGLYITENLVLTNIDGLSDVTSIGGGFTISNNQELTNMNGLSGVTNIEGSITISNNQELTNINGLSGITSIGAELQITNNPILTDIDGFSAVTSIEGYLQIEDNQTLTTIDGLSGVTSIDGSLSIWNNDTLTNLDGFLGVISINGDIYIGENANLNDISGLANINSATIGGFDGLYIESNPNLAICNLPNFCEYLSNPAGTHPRTISDNLAECINEAALLNACFPCPEPTDFVADHIDDESVDLSWQAGDAETQWEVNYGTPGFNPDTDGTSVTVNSNPELVLLGLTANTSYEVYVRAVCGIDDESSWTGPVSFTTLEACQIAECVENKTVDSDMGDCFYTHSGIAWDAAIDQNCSIDTIEYELVGDTDTSGFVTGNTLDGIQFNVGVTTVTWRITYINTNVDTCSFTVTVEDNEDPTILVKNFTLQLDNTGNGVLMVSDIDNGSHDNCGIVTSILSKTTFTCLDEGENVVTLTVTDAAGNSASDNATVTVLVPINPITVNINSTVAPNDINNVVIFDGADASLGLPSSTTLSAEGIPSTYTGLTYQWFWRDTPSGAFQSSPISTSPSIVVDASGEFAREYKLVVSSNSGCIAEDTISIISIEASCGNNSNKVLVCFVSPNGNSTTICLNANAVNALLAAHPGSYIGSCNITYQTTSQTQEGNFLEVESWPNPSNDMFSILVNSTNTTEPINYIVYDLAGRFIEESAGKVGETFMVGDRYSTGVYVVKVSQGSTARFIKLVKK